MCGAGWGGEWGVSHLLRETPPHSDRTTLSLDSPPPTHLRAAATAAGPRPPALASYCPQHPGPAGPPIHKYTRTRSAHTHTHTHTPKHTGQGVMASARRRSERVPAGPHPARPPPPLLRSPPLFRFSSSSFLCLKTPPNFPSAHASRVTPGPEDLTGRRGLRKERRELVEGRV